MICQYCQKNEATFHLQKIINNSIVEIHLCYDCSRKELQKDVESGIEEKVHTIVEGLLESGDRVKEINKTIGCNICNTTLNDFEKNGLLGCPECYSVFKNVITKKYIKDKSIKYYEKKERITQNSRIGFLEIELKKAVQSEDFEKAAILRDEIKQYNKGFPK